MVSQRESKATDAELVKRFSHGKQPHILVIARHVGAFGEVFLP